MVPEFDHQNGVQKWHPKGGPNIILVNKDLQEIKSLFKNIGSPFWVPLFGPHFGGQILAPFFGSIFQPPFWGPKMVQNLQKFLLSKLHSETFSSKQTCTSKCICSHFPANSIFEHNSILHLVKPSKITTSRDSHKCCTYKQDGLEPQSLILWRSLHATPVFYMKNNPVLGVVKADIFRKCIL